MLCVEDYLDALKWAAGLGGLPALRARSAQNLAVFEAWVAKTPWIEFLAADPTQRSSTSICFSLVADWLTQLGPEDQSAALKKLTSLLDGEGVAYDIDSYRSAPPGLRIWGGATVEASDIAALLPWLEWAYEQVAAQYKAA